MNKNDDAVPIDGAMPRQVPAEETVRCVPFHRKTQLSGRVLSAIYEIAAIVIFGLFCAKWPTRAKGVGTGLAAVMLGPIMDLYEITKLSSRTRLRKSRINVCAVFSDFAVLIIGLTGFAMSLAASIVPSPDVERYKGGNPWVDDAFNANWVLLGQIVIHGVFLLFVMIYLFAGWGLNGGTREL